MWPALPDIVLTLPTMDAEMMGSWCPVPPMAVLTAEELDADGTEIGK